MKRLASPILVLAVVAALVGACRQYMPQNRYLQLRARPTREAVTAEARRKFGHKVHANIFERAAVTCVDCHRFDVLLDVRNEQLARELSYRAQYPPGAICHHCHGPGEQRVAEAPKACTTCHDNLEPLRPADHDVAWMKVHAGMARVNAAQCETCHRQAECIDCHQRRDSIQTRVHDRNFRFFHGIQVRANPMQCGSCHREDFCIRCHERGGIEGFQG